MRVKYGNQIRKIGEIIIENKKSVGVKKEIKGDREQFQKLFHTFANHWNFSNNLNFST